MTGSWLLLTAITLLSMSPVMSQSEATTPPPGSYSPDDQPGWDQLTAELIETLTLAPVGDDLFVGQSRDFVGKRVFGGQVLGQALMAASLTTDIGPAHSMHAYFLKGGDPGQPIHYQVERLRDGRSVVSRQVRALQRDELIFVALVSFAAAEQGLDFQIDPPVLPAVDSLTDEDELKARIAPFLPDAVRANFLRRRHIELRLIDPPNPFPTQPQAPRRGHYMRVNGQMPDDQRLHQAAVAFASDYALMSAGLLPHAIGFLTPNLQAASLDHSLYFHHPVRANDWLLHDISADVTSGGRGLNTGQIWQDGRLVATAVQEGLMRLRESKNN